MTQGEGEDSHVYTVVVSAEEEYSIWPADREIPAGWRAAGRTGRKDECLAYIRETWTDMRPLSLRKAMELQTSRANATSAKVSSVPAPPQVPTPPRPTSST
jgi:MbtH protein